MNLRIWSSISHLMEETLMVLFRCISKDARNYFSVFVLNDIWSNYSWCRPENFSLLYFTDFPDKHYMIVKNKLERFPVGILQEEFYYCRNMLLTSTTFPSTLSSWSALPDSLLILMLGSLLNFHYCIAESLEVFSSYYFCSR